MNINRNQAILSLRRTVEDRSRRGMPTETEIANEITRAASLEKGSMRSLRRIIDAADPNELRDRLDDLEDRIEALESRNRGNGGGNNSGNNR